MKATVYHAAGDVRVETVPDPKIQDAKDAIVRVVNAAICGSDLWAYRGVSKGEPGTRTGHEFIGIIEETGSDVKKFKKGDFVAAPFNFSDGDCTFCLEETYNSCVHVGYWGGQNDGGQGQFVRVPFADATLSTIPDAVGHDQSKRTSALALTDVMSTGHHGNVRARVKAGGSVVVIGDGAVGLCGVLAAKRLGAERIIAVGHHASRLEIAKTFGATDIVDSKADDAKEQIIEMTKGGPQSVVEAVGGQDTLNFAISICRPGGNVSYVGIPHGTTSFDARRLFIDNISIGGAIAPAHKYIDELMADVASGKIDPSPVFTMRLPLEESPAGYKAMSDRTAIKVVLDISSL
jgi:threonine dehydrogenase-like Zn-dependent dehydrogenase